MADRKLYNYTDAMTFIEENKSKGWVSCEELEKILGLEGTRSTNSSYSSAICTLKKRCIETFGLSIKAKRIDDVPGYAILKTTKNILKAKTENIISDTEKALQANNVKLLQQKEEAENKYSELEAKYEELLLKEQEYKTIISSLSRLANVGI